MSNTDGDRAELQGRTQRECAKWRCENDRKDGYAFCEEHPPLVHHGLQPNDTECPECGEVGAGTIHDDLWYCLDDYGYDGCGALFDPYDVADVEKEREWRVPQEDLAE